MELPPCIGCGYCCREAPCVYGDTPICRQLIKVGGLYRCQLITDASVEDIEWLTLDLFIGDGCVRAYNSDRAKMLKAKR